MAGPSPSAAKWLSYISDTALLEEDENPSQAMFWCNQQAVDNGACSVDGIDEKLDAVDDAEKNESRGKKRVREDQGKDFCNKANREKMRRDRLNDRFLELSKALEPGKAPKTDKASILCDAVRVLGQLRSEAQQLRDNNSQLRDQIKDLKAEKNELRDEKARLKLEKEKLEQQVKSVPAVPTGYVPHAAAMQAAAAAYAQAQVQAAHAAQVQVQKTVAPTSYPPVAMWQWIPPAALDTSQDHVLRPPVA